MSTMNPPHNVHEEGVPLNTDARIAVMSVQIGHIADAVERIERSSSGNVPRAEWEQRNLYVDTRIIDLASKIAETRTDTAAGLAKLTTEIQSRRAPWWSVGAIVISAAALAVVVIPILSQ